MNAGSTVRWGVILTARINDEVIPAIQRSTGAELLAVASRDGQRARDYASSRAIPRAYGSYEELLGDDDIDCVYISLPNSMHAALTVAALDAGKHVLCEKPLAVSRAEGAMLFEHARGAGRVLMEAFMYRHHDKTRRLRELVRDEALGEIETIRASFHFFADDPVGDVRFQPELAGGALRDLGSYCTSVATYLMDRAPVRVAGAARLAPSGVDESFAGVLDFGETAATAVFDCGMRSDLTVGLSVLGTEGIATVAMPWYPHRPPATIEIRRGDAVTTIETSDDNAYQLEVENFCAAIAGEQEPAVSGEETYESRGAGRARRRGGPAPFPTRTEGTRPPMTALHSRSLLDLAPPDLRAHLEHDDTILIPLGSCEMHGDHMPLGTDIYNAIEVCRRAAEKADTLYGPPIWSGYSPQHLREPERGMGTITMRSHTLECLIHDTARSLIHHGFNRLIFVNGRTSNTKVTDRSCATSATKPAR